MIQRGPLEGATAVAAVVTELAVLEVVPDVLGGVVPDVLGGGAEPLLVLVAEVAPLGVLVRSSWQPPQAQAIAEKPTVQDQDRQVRHARHD